MEITNTQRARLPRSVQSYIENLERFCDEHRKVMNGYGWSDEKTKFCVARLNTDPRVAGAREIYMPLQVWDTIRMHGVAVRFRDSEIEVMGESPRTLTVKPWAANCVHLKLEKRD